MRVPVKQYTYQSAIRPLQWQSWNVAENPGRPERYELERVERVERVEWVEELGGL